MLIGILFAKFGANLYVAVAFVTAPLIHAGFFNALGWGDYMPFLSLPAR